MEKNFKERKSFTILVKTNLQIPICCLMMQKLGIHAQYL